MKKTFALLLTFLLLFSSAFCLTSCKKKEEGTRNEFEIDNLGTYGQTVFENSNFKIILSEIRGLEFAEDFNAGGNIYIVLNVTNNTDASVNFNFINVMINGSLMALNYSDSLADNFLSGGNSKSITFSVKKEHLKKDNNEIAFTVTGENAKKGVVFISDPIVLTVKNAKRGTETTTLPETVETTTTKNKGTEKEKATRQKVTERTSMDFSQMVEKMKEKAKNTTSPFS